MCSKKTSSRLSVLFLFSDLSALWDSYDQFPTDLVPWGLHVTNPESQEIIGEEIKNFFTDGKGFNGDLATGIKVSYID